MRSTDARSQRNRFPARGPGAGDLTRAQPGSLKT